MKWVAFEDRMINLEKVVAVQRDPDDSRVLLVFCDGGFKIKIENDADINKLLNRIHVHAG